MRLARLLPLTSTALTVSQVSAFQPQQNNPQAILLQDPVNSAIITGVNTSTIASSMSSPSSVSKSLNVFHKPLALHSTSPMTGFLRNGYCEVPASDYGNHAVAAEVSDAFLDFSASRGNDLRQAGLKDGCKWCLCAGRWYEAYAARGEKGEGIVPKVFLNATNEKALDKIDLEILKKYAVDKEG